MKKLLAVILSVCVLFAMSTVVSAAGDATIETDIVTTKRVCPGAYVNDKTIGAPEVAGPVFSEGWEIKLPGSADFVPYEGQALDEADDGAVIRYYVATYDGDYDYSNECVLIVKHNPTGSYLYSGTDHWRVCADCGGKSGEDLHSFFESSSGGSSGGETACSVCGAHRTSQWTGLAAFFEWVFALIASLLG